MYGNKLNLYVLWVIRGNKFKKIMTALATWPSVSKALVCPGVGTRSDHGRGRGRGRGGVSWPRPEPGTIDTAAGRSDLATSLHRPRGHGDNSSRVGNLTRLVPGGCVTVCSAHRDVSPWCCSCGVLGPVRGAGVACRVCPELLTAAAAAPAAAASRHSATAHRRTSRRGLLASPPRLQPLATPPQPRPPPVATSAPKVPSEGS